MKIKQFQKYLLSGSFSLFVVATMSITLLMAIIFYYISYKSYISNKQDSLKQVSKRIDYLLADAFDRSGRLMLYIGRHINKNNYQDLNYINSLLKKTTDREHKAANIWSWSMYDWVDNNNMLSVNRVIGVIADPKDMSHREHTWKCRANPWTLQFSSPAIGSPSGMWVIPAGVGITSEDEEFLGILVVGFNVLELTEMLLEKTNGDQISFLILDQNNSVILNSDKPNFFMDDQNKISLDDSDMAEMKINHAGLLHSQARQDNVTYLYYRKMHDFPYTIVIGIDYGACMKDFLLKMLPSLLQITSLGIFCIILMYFSRKKVIDIGKNATRAKEDLAAHVNERLNLHLNSILHYSEILTRYLHGEIRIGMDKNRQLEFLANIYKAAAAAKNIDSTSFEFSTIDLNTVLENSIDIHSMSILQGNISLSKKLHEESLLINGDQLFMKQIVVGLLSYSINSVSMGGDVFVTTCIERDMAILEIIYSTVELKHPDITRNKRDGHIESIDLDYAVRLVEIHGGTLNIRSKGMIKIITAVFPIVQNEVECHAQSLLT